MFLPFERSPGVPKYTPARSMGWSCSAHRQHLHLATPVTRPDSVWFLRVGFRQGQCLRPTNPKDTTRTAREHQQFSLQVNCILLMAELNESLQNYWRYFETHLYIYSSDIVIDSGRKLYKFTFLGCWVCWNQNDSCNFDVHLLSLWWPWSWTFTF